MATINNKINAIVGKTDIYLIDQIVKGRYLAGDSILDAGSGKGRNLHWFYQNKINIHGIDMDENHVYSSRISYPRIKDQIHCLSIEDSDQLGLKFDHIICNAVLHFANSKKVFLLQWKQLFSLLKPDGTFFIRMCSDIGIEAKLKALNDGVYLIPDGTRRFLLTRDILNELQLLYGFELIEPLKTVNVNDIRSMSTLIVRKK